MSTLSKSNISSSIDKSVLAGLNFKKSILKLTETFVSSLTKEDINVLMNYKRLGYLYMNNLCRNSNIDFTNIKLDNYYFDNNYIKDTFTYINKVKNPYEKQGMDNINYIIYDILIFIKNILYSIHVLDTIFTKVKYTISDLAKAMGINKNEFVLYRATNIPNICNYKLGDTLSFNEYLSCSNNKKVSLGFTNISNPEHVFFIIKNIDKCPFVFIDWLIGKNEKIKLDLYDEYECLLPRYCEFKITKIYYTSAYYKYYKHQHKENIINKINNEIDNITNYTIKKDNLLSMIKNIKHKKLRVIELEFVKCNKPQCDISKILKENIKLFSKRIIDITIGMYKDTIINVINNKNPNSTLKKTKTNLNNTVISSKNSIKPTKTTKAPKTTKSTKTTKAPKTVKSSKSAKSTKTVKASKTDKSAK